MEMDNTEDNLSLKILRVLLISTPFLFTLIYIPGFTFPGSFPKAIFLYIAVSIILIVWLINIYRTGVVVFKKNWINIAVFGYILTLFISGIASGHFEESLFGAISRMTGIATMLYISGWYLVASSVLKPRHFTYVFRGLLFSGAILAVISFLGLNGFGLQAFSFLEQGGSLFSNNTFSGIYYVFAFFLGAILFTKENSLKWRISYALAMLVILLNPDIFNFQIWQNFGMIKELFSHPSLVLGTARASSAVMGIGIILTLILYVIHRVRGSVVVKSVLFSFIVLVLAGVSLGFVGSTIAQKGFGADFFASQNDIHRPTAWKQVASGFSNRPLLGYGINNIEYAFQDTLGPEIPFIKGEKWFDKAHNIWLDLALETGILGILSVIILFISACWYSFKHYRDTRDFSAPLVLLLLVLHLIQIQTSFNINTSLFMIFILFAYVSSFSPENISYSVSPRTKSITLWAGVILIAGAMIFTAIIPAKHSRELVGALTSASFEKRMNMYKSSHSIYGYPADYAYFITERFTNAWLENPAIFDNPTARAGIATEYNAMIDLYEAHYNQYRDNLRYNMNYANNIFIARLFGVNRLDRAGELIARAQELSTRIPQVFWLASLHAKYTGNEELAFKEADKAIALCEAVRARFNENQLGEFCGVSYSLRGFLEKTKGLNNKLYFHLQTI